MLSGILHPTSGSATVLGHTHGTASRCIRSNFPLSWGKNQLWWDLPAQESFLLNKEIYEVPDADYQETVEELTALLDVEDLLDIPVRKLSLG